MKSRKGSPINHKEDNMFTAPRTVKLDIELHEPNRKDPCSKYLRMFDHAEELEQELAAVTAERDALRESLRHDMTKVVTAMKDHETQFRRKLAAVKAERDELRSEFMREIKS